MKDIDLTKCVNCRFRAKVDGNKVAGRIEKSKSGFLLTGDDVFGCVVTPAELDNLLRGADLTVEDEGFYISGFEIVPRDPETYRDWQVGDTIEYSDNYSTGRIIFRGGDFVAADIEGTCNCYTCDELFNEGYRLVLTDIGQKIIEGKKKREYEPQDGDICYAETKLGNQKFIIIYNHRDWSLEYGVKSDKWRLVENCSWSYSTIRPATDEEKQRLFDAMAKKGKRWNAEKKVVEDIPKPYEFSEFRKGDVVLYRDYGGFWKIGVFVEMRYVYDKYVTTTDGVDECGYRECIPYNERTMHLLGRFEDYKEED